MIDTILRAWREKRGLTQVEAAAKIGCTQATLSRWEAGLHAPSPDGLRKIARAMRVSFGSLERVMAGAR